MTSYWYEFNRCNDRQRPYEIEAGKRCSNYFNKKIITDNNLDGKYDILLEDNVTIEVKTHFQLYKWNTFFIEYKYDGKPSGIRTSCADYYCLTDTINYYLIKTINLKQLIEDNINEIDISKPNDKTKTQGYKISKKLLIDSSKLI
jgi:hypothetical protein